MMEVKNTVNRLPQFKQNLDSLFNKAVIVGVLNNKGAQEEALKTEYGTPSQPTNPFFERAVRKANKENSIIMQVGGAEVLAGKKTTEDVLTQVGKNTVETVKKEGEDQQVPQSVIDNIGYKVV